MYIMMDTTTALLLYKVISVIAGLLLCYMGYRLFMSGVWGNSGDLTTQFGDTKLLLKSAAPGTFFVVLGTVVLLATIWKGLNFPSAAQPQDLTSRAATGEPRPNFPDKPGQRIGD
jgi:hypothetical protein